jgi:hypothetical protein
MVYALRRAGSLALPTDNYLALWVTSGNWQLLQLDQRSNNDHDHYHQLQQPHFYPIPPIMLCFLLCATQFHSTTIVNFLHNDDAAGPPTAPDCLPRNPGVGDHVHRYSPQSSTIFMLTTDETYNAMNYDYRRPPHCRICSR